MILTITPNPVFESIYYIDNLQPKIKNKAHRVIYNISGQGLNTSRILKNHNIDVFAMGFLGGLKGEYIFNRLRDLKIYNDFTLIRDETKGEVFLIKDNEILTIISENNPRITREELNSFYELYDNISKRTDFICALGDLPIGVPKEFYFHLAQIARKNNKKLILDIRDVELIYGTEGKPFMIKVNKEDLEEISKVELNFESEIIKIGRGLLEKDIEIIVIDLNEKGNIVLTKDRGYRLEIPNMNLGNMSEDKGYIVSGYAFGFERQYDLETVMKLGQAMRIAYGISEDLDIIYMSDIKKIMSRIEISSINY